MVAAIDDTHDSSLASWVESANGHADFPIQNLPLCIYSLGDGERRGAVAIGDRLLDVARLADAGVLPDADRDLLRFAAGPTLNSFFTLTAADRRRFRTIMSAALTTGRREVQALAETLLVNAAEAILHLPADVGDYTDFFAGIFHARNAGKMFRPDNPLLPNYKHVPIAYHGRSSSIRASGHPVRHPVGQRAPHGATTPDFGESRRLDYELELGIWVRGGNDIGEPIPIERAGAEIVGFCLLNDWSARDIQAWETQPLGPFLGKNFLTTVSPFVVTAEALAPFSTAQPAREAGDPSPLPYLLDEDDQRGGAFDIRLEVHLTTQAMRETGAAPRRLTRSSGLDLYWTPAQMVAHHTSNGCNLRPGDLLGTGTISANDVDGHGSLLELTRGGTEPVDLADGETRTFLQDGDEVIFSGWCEREGFVRIGFGEARGTVVPHLRHDLTAALGADA